MKKFFTLIFATMLASSMSIQNHKASLKERFEVMRNNYGIITTLLVHAKHTSTPFVQISHNISGILIRLPNACDINTN